MNVVTPNNCYGSRIYVGEIFREFANEEDAEEYEQSEDFQKLLQKEINKRKLKYRKEFQKQ